MSTGDSQIDATVVTAEWFASEEFPSATFLSTQITGNADAGYEVSGELTIRGVTVPVVFPMQLSGTEYSGEWVIDRTEFGIGVGGQDEFVAPEVSISFRFDQAQ